MAAKPVSNKKEAEAQKALCSLASHHLSSYIIDMSADKIPESLSFASISSSHLSFLRLAAFLPPVNRSFRHPLSRLLQLYNHVVVAIYLGMWTGYGYRMLQRRDLEIDYICEQMVVEGVVLRYVVICAKREQIVELVESCERLWKCLRAGEDRIVRQFERKAHYFRNFMLLNSLLVVVLFIGTAQFARLPPLVANGTERRMLPFRYYRDVQEEPEFSLVYAMQALDCTSISFIIASIETLSLYVVMMACGYLRSLRIRLLSLAEMSDDDDDDDDGSVLELVLGCAHLHQQIMLFCDEIDRMTRTIFLFACFTTIYNMSITAIKLLENDENKFKFMAILVLNLFQFFTCQWAPEFLIIESEAIGKAAYFASLQPLASIHRTRINRILYFMMMRAQKPVQLKAGGIIDLSIETFGSMVKNAFSFFAVLRSVGA